MWFMCDRSGRLIWLLNKTIHNTMCVWLCVMEVGSLGGRTTLVTHYLRTYYTLCCVCTCVITSRCSWGSAAEEDVVREQQLKQTQSGSSSETNARQRCYYTRLLVCQSVAVADSHRHWWRRWGLRSIPMSAVKRELSCTLLCYHK